MGIVLRMFFRFNADLRQWLQDAFDVDLSECVHGKQEISNHTIIGCLRRMSDWYGEHQQTGQEEYKGWPSMPLHYSSHDPSADVDLYRDVDSPYMSSYFTTCCIYRFRCPSVLYASSGKA